jgi:UDP-N-acetylglucosamine 4-epimerase
LSPYAVSKLVNEQYAAIFSSVYQMKIVGLRYFNVFGPRQNPKGDYAAAIPLFIDSVLNDKDVFINGNGEQSRDFTFVSNAVQGNILALLKPFSNTMNDVFNIAFGSSVTVNELYFEIAGLLSSSKKPIYRSERFGDVLHSKADITKAKQVLSFEPLVNFHEGLKETVNWFKNSH